ncbi:hypothetical protein C8N47_11173 [Mangrovibacterium marinum]|uniref:Tail protein n=1 Tax=Mangrovibacterium marinum TaxID=1639118 RepID=A0A2T5C0I3_9BACT|nr:hypothetical protein [Mangrovibacterium marinum]PTN08033.1 hypothetical protein C8N47_11173 [Mangrovibacterium marinum]
MAYGTIIQFQYKDIHDVNTVVRIKQLDYSGAVTYRNYMSAGAKFTWGDSSNTIPVIYGSQCTLYVESENDYEFSYLFSSNARKHLVEVEKSGQLFWIGFIEPDSWSEPLVAVPYSVEFTAYDGLGMLDNIDFVDDNGDAYTGRMTMLALIQQLLNNTGVRLNLNTATDLKEEQQEVGTDYFEVHSVNLEAFEGMTCFEVLEQVLQGHRILQRNGEWWITSYTLIPVGGDVTYRSYENGSAVSSGNIIQSIEDESSWWSEGETDMNMLPAVRNITIEQDYGYQSNVIKNGDFSQLDGSGNLKYWDVSDGFGYAIKPLDSDGNVYLFIPMQLSAPIFDGVWKSIDFLNAGNGSLKLSFKYGIVSNSADLNTTFSLYIWFAAEDGSYYSLVNSDDEWVWTPGSLPTILPSTIGVYTLAEIGENLRSFSETIPPIPNNGVLKIGLDSPNSPDIIGAAYADFSLELLLDEEDSYSGSKSFTVINNQNNNNVPDDISLVIGVIPQIVNNDVIYKGGILRADGSPSSGFASGSSAFYSWAELIGRINSSIQRSPRRAYEGTFADIIPRMNLVISDANNSNLRLLETGISFDDFNQTIEGQYVEVLSLSLVTGQESDYVINGSSSTGSSSGAGASGGSSGSMSIANWDTLNNRPAWTDYFEVVNPGTASEYIRAKTSFAADGEVTAFGIEGYTPGTIWDNLPVASPSALGGVKVGDGLSIDANGVLSANVTGGVSSWIELTDKPDWLSYTTLSEFQTGHAHAFASLTSKPTTLSGYGITDGVLTTDSRLSDSRPASDVYSWAKASSKPSYTYSEVGAAAASHTHTFASLTSKPTTLSGYGITDGVLTTDSRLSDSRPASDVYSWAKASSKPSYTYSEVGAAAASHTHTFASLTSKPTTLSGYGITDGVLITDSRLSDSRPASDVYSWAKASSKPSYTYSEVGAAAASHTHTFASLTSKPTTLSGYGITDGVLTTDSRLSDSRPASDVYSWAKASSKPSYTYSEVGAAAASHTHTFASLTSKPTTLSGYGITNALPLSGGTLTGTLTGTIGAFSGALKTNSLFELRNASGTKKWTFELSGDDLVFKNAAGTSVGKLDQSGNFAVIAEVTAYATL